MTLRRYQPIAKSRGTVIPRDIRVIVVARDRGCVGPRVGMLGECFGALELDHVRGSGALGRKSPTTEDNLVALCSTHHRTKTEAGRTWRPLLLAYLERTER
jgi:5-methylcytosine-specific restriction endonuclease McrA